MSEEGFTLVETLVALALGAMVVAAVLSTVKVAANGARRAGEATASAEDLARAAAMLRGDADHAVYLADALGRASFIGQAAAMDLPQRPRDGAAPRVVQYRLEPDAGDTRLTRDGIEIWRAPGEMGFRYLAPSGQWQTDWALPGLPDGFALWERGTEVLATPLPDLLPLSCSLGPGPACPLDAGDFR